MEKKATRYAESLSFFVIRLRGGTADTTDLKSVSLRSMGSNPIGGTMRMVGREVMQRIANPYNYI